MRAAGHSWLAVAGIVLCVSQIESGVLLGVARLGDFGRSAYPPISLAILASIKDLPPDAKLAYACGPSEEVAFWDSRLIGLDAHTGRQVVPMCFEADTPILLTDSPTSEDIPNPLFQWAPQRMLYPDSSAHPSPATATSFLRANGIDYIYADALHPNSLVPSAIPIAESGDTQVLRIP